MSLNEEYLDELLKKAVTTEDDNSKSQPVLNKKTNEKELMKEVLDNERDIEETQEKKHTFSEDDLTEMLEHLEEIDASSISDTDISEDSFISEPVVKETMLEEPVTEMDISEAEYDEEENDEATTMAESAEYMSDIDELLKNIEETSSEIPKDGTQELQSQEDNLNEIINGINDNGTVENNLSENELHDADTPADGQDDSEIEDSEFPVQKEESTDGTAYDDAVSENVDIMSLLGAMDDDGELAEIGDLLQKDENHEAIDNDDMMAMLEQAAALEEQNKKEAVDSVKNEINEDSDDIGEEKKKKGFFGWKKKKKAKKEEENPLEEILEEETSETKISEENLSENEDSSDNKAVKVKKKSILAKILDLFFEEENIEEFVPGVGEEGASDENIAILEQLDKEKLEKKKEKKKKEKKKKEKKPKEKKEREKKPKKQKVPKEPKKQEPDDRPDKKIPGKKIIGVAIFAITILTVLLIIVILIPNKIALQNATMAYEEQDYKTAYITLAGMKINEKEKTILKKTTVILELQEKYDAYVNYEKMGMKMEALNSLFQGIIRYDKLNPYAQEMKVSPELDNTYQQIISALDQNYGISEAEAREIIAYDKVTYTKKLDSMINGTEFIDPNAPVAEPETLEDMLPEEELMMQETNKANKSAEETTEGTTEENNSTEDVKSNDTESEKSTEQEGRELFSGNVSGSGGTVDFSEQGIEEQQDDSNN